MESVQVDEKVEDLVKEKDEYEFYKLDVECDILGSL